MKTDVEILDEFGQIVTRDVHDELFYFISSDLGILAQSEGVINLFANMSQIQKKELESYIDGLLTDSIFQFLKIFDENSQFKLIFEDEDGRVKDLNKISDMLKAEPLIENGWIQRFSRYKKSE
jgi:hypothetical protein